MAQLQPPPIVKLRASTAPINYHSQIQSHHHQNQMSPYSDIDDSGAHGSTILQIPLREKQQLVNNSTVQRRESDAYQAAIKARRTGLIGSYIESKAKENHQHSSDDEEALDQPQQASFHHRQLQHHPSQRRHHHYHRSSPDEDISSNSKGIGRNSKVNTPTVTITSQEVSTVPPPPIKKRQSKVSNKNDGHFLAKEAALSVAKPKPPNVSFKIFNCRTVT